MRGPRAGPPRQASATRSARPRAESRARDTPGRVGAEAPPGPPSHSPPGGALVPRPRFRARPCAPPVAGAARDPRTHPRPVRPCRGDPSSPARARRRPAQAPPAPAARAEGGATSPRVTCSPRLGALAGGDRGDPAGLGQEAARRHRQVPGAGTHRERRELLRGRRREQPREQRQPAEPGQQHGDRARGRRGSRPPRARARAALGAAAAPCALARRPGSRRRGCSGSSSPALRAARTQPAALPAPGGPPRPLRLPWLLSNNCRASRILLPPACPPSALPPPSPTSRARRRAPLAGLGRPLCGGAAPARACGSRRWRGGHQGCAVSRGCCVCLPPSLHAHTRVHTHAHKCTHADTHTRAHANARAPWESSRHDHKMRVALLPSQGPDPVRARPALVAASSHRVNSKPRSVPNHPWVSWNSGL